MSFSGFPDWQRTTLWDSPQLYAFDGNSHNVPVQSSVLDVSNWGSLAGRVFLTAGKALLTVQWWQDPVAGIPIGQRICLLDANVNSWGAFRYPNLAPFATVSLSPIAAGAYTPIGRVFATNRAHPLEKIPFGPVLASVPGVNVNNGATSTTWAKDYYSGPLLVWTGMVTTPWLVTLQGFDENGTATTIDQWPTAGARLSVKTYAPDGAWNIQLTNSTGANNNAFMTATPTLTGAS